MSSFEARWISSHQADLSSAQKIKAGISICQISFHFRPRWLPDKLQFLGKKQTKTWDIPQGDIEVIENQQDGKDQRCSSYGYVKNGKVAVRQVNEQVNIWPTQGVILGNANPL